MRKFKTLPVASIIFMASAATAQQSVPATPATVGSAAKPMAAEKPICRSETSTGSRFSKKICHTKAEWSAMSADGAAALEASRRPH